MGLRTYRRARRQGEPQSSFLKLFLAATYHCPEWPFWGAKKAPEQAGCVGPYVALCGHRGGGQGVPRGFGLTGNSLEVVAENTKVGSDLGEPPPPRVTTSTKNLCCRTTTWTFCRSVGLFVYHCSRGHNTQAAATNKHHTLWASARGVAKRPPSRKSSVAFGSVHGSGRHGQCEVSRGGGRCGVGWGEGCAPSMQHRHVGTQHSAKGKCGIDIGGQGPGGTRHGGLEGTGTVAEEGGGGKARCGQTDCGGREGGRQGR